MHVTQSTFKHNTSFLRSLSVGTKGETVAQKMSIKGDIGIDVEFLSGLVRPEEVTEHIRTRWPEILTCFNDPPQDEKWPNIEGYRKIGYACLTSRTAERSDFRQRSYVCF